MINPKILIPPTRRNGITGYIKQYLNNVTSWQTYANTDPSHFSDKMREVTQSFFNPTQLKGAGTLFALHLLQQTTASTATLIARTFLRGEKSDLYKGIAVRTLQLNQWWAKHKPPFLGSFVEPIDSYYFHEGGRTWHCCTFSFNIPGQGAKELTLFHLLSFPNRSYYFDRPLPYNQAIDLALAQITPENIPGFLGDTNELDCLMPVIGFFKLGLYGLNWLLVDNDERDSDSPAVDGYNNWYPIPPHTNNPPGFTAAKPTPLGFNPTPNSGPTAAYSKPSYYNTPPQPPSSPSPWTPNQSQPPTPPWADTPPYPSPFPAPASSHQTLTLSPASITLKLVSKNNEAISCSVEAHLVLLPQGQPSGLAIVPQIEATANGEYVQHPQQWLLAHTPSGLTLNAEFPLPTIDATQALAAQLIQLTNWLTPLDKLPQAALDKATLVIQQFVHPSQPTFNNGYKHPHNGYHNPSFGFPWL